MEHVQLRTDIVTEWQTKTIASFIAGTVRMEKGQENPLLKAVEQIKLVNQDRTGRPENRQAASSEMSLEEIMEKGSPTAADQNGIGSFERALRGFRA